MAAGTARRRRLDRHRHAASIEAIQGTNFTDIYDATSFGTRGRPQLGSNGTFNQFEGLGGNDTITGNGNTRVISRNATGGVTIKPGGGGTRPAMRRSAPTRFIRRQQRHRRNFADTYVATGFVGDSAPSTAAPSTCSRARR